MRTSRKRYRELLQESEAAYEAVCILRDEDRKKHIEEMKLVEANLDYWHEWYQMIARSFASTHRRLLQEDNELKANIQKATN